MSTEKSGNIVTSEVRFSFVNIFKPQKSLTPGGDDKYGLTLLFPDPKTLAGKPKAEYEACIAALKAAAYAVAVDKWGANNIPKVLRSPFRDQGEKEYDGYVPGAVFISATSKQKPSTVDAQVNDILDPSAVYSGCYGRVSVRAFAYDKGGNRGVAFGLQNVQKLRDGEPLGNRTSPQDDFTPLADDQLAGQTAGDGANSLFK